MLEIIIKHADTGQVAVNRLGLQPSTQKVIRVLRHLPMVHLLDSNIDPKHKMFKDVHVVLHRVLGVVASFQESPVVHDHVRNPHLPLSFL